MEDVSAAIGGYGSGRLWRCDECGEKGQWGEGWVWWGSLRDVDDGIVPYVRCPKHGELPTRPPFNKQLRERRVSQQTLVREPCICPTCQNKHYPLVSKEWK